jgi:hypothetical protein
MDDAYESRENGESLEGHVFELLVTVDNWLHGRTMTMDDYIDDRYGESDEQ